MKKKSLILFISILVLIVGFVFVVKGVIGSIDTNLKQLTNLPIADIDLFQTEDGTYVGSYNVFPVLAEVEVTVLNQTIIAIDLIKHRHGQGAPAEIITGKVIEAQSLEVDVTSGATYSSKVILKAIEEALADAVKK